MSKLFDVSSIIVAAQDADTTTHVYTQVYGGSAGCTITINDISVEIGMGSTVDIAIRTVSGGDGCYLLGENNNVGDGSTVLGG